MPNHFDLFVLFALFEACIHWIFCEKWLSLFHTKLTYKDSQGLGQGININPSPTRLCSLLKMCEHKFFNYRIKHLTFNQNLCKEHIFSKPIGGVRAT